MPATDSPDMQRAAHAPRARVPPRRLLLGVIVVLLLLLAWGAVTGAVRQLPRSATPGQQLQTGLQFAAGLLSLLVVPARRWRTPGRRLQVAWLVTLALAAGLSALVWGPPMTGVAALFMLLAGAFGAVVLAALAATSERRQGRAVIASE
jgi:peptidoglycan/LPS O-acetylase OafA/YrhL